MANAASQKRKEEAERRKAALVRRYQGMLTLNDLGCANLLFTFRMRILNVRSMRTPLSDDDRATLRQLIADLATMTAQMKHLAKLFESEDAILACAAACEKALLETVRCWQAKSRPDAADLDALDEGAALFTDILRQTKMSEFEAVSALVLKELSR